MRRIGPLTFVLLCQDAAGEFQFAAIGSVDWVFFHHTDHGGVVQGAAGIFSACYFRVSGVGCEHRKEFRPYGCVSVN